MHKVPRIKAKDFFKYLQKFGCTEISVRGSHHKVKNEKNNKISVIAIHGGDIISGAMFSVILKQLEIDEKEFIQFIEN